MHVVFFCYRRSKVVDTVECGIFLESKSMRHHKGRVSVVQRAVNQLEHHGRRSWLSTATRRLDWSQLNNGVLQRTRSL